MEPTDESNKSVHQKVVGYLFNRASETGWPKGQWFVKALGFNPNNQEHIKMLEEQITFDSANAIFRGTTPFGKKYDLLISIKGPNGKTIRDIKTVWQMDTEDKSIRLITIISPKKSKK